MYTAIRERCVQSRKRERMKKQEKKGEKEKGKERNKNGYNKHSNTEAQLAMEWDIRI